MACALMVTGCASHTVSSYRTPGADLGVRGIRIVFEDSDLKVERFGRVNDNTANQQRLLLGNALVERLPAVFRENAVPASARTLPSASIPASRDFSSVFPPDQSGWHTLVVTPASGSVVCTTGCDYYFRVSLRLVEPGSLGIVWSATVDQPRLGGIGTRQAVYEYFANDLAKIVLRQVGKAAPADAIAVRPDAAFAPIHDVAAVPYLNERGRQGYQEWLRRSPPRAFAIARNGQWSSTSGVKPRNPEDPADPAQRALAQCRQKATDCKLYAVDNRVVWEP